MRSYDMRHPPEAQGVLLGAWEMLGKTLRRLNGTYGPCRIGSECHMVGVLPELFEYQYMVTATSPTIGIAATATETLYTTPKDERWKITHLYITRATGDNTMSEVLLRLPTGYYSGTAGAPGSIALGDTGAGGNANFRWPLPYLPTGYVYFITPSIPLILEPGTEVRSGFGGVGTATSTWTVTISGRVTKVIRDRVPG